MSLSISGERNSSSGPYCASQFQAPSIDTALLPLAIAKLPRGSETGFVTCDQLFKPLTGTVKDRPKSVQGPSRFEARHLLRTVGLALPPSRSLAVQDCEALVLGAPFLVEAPPAQVLKASAATLDMLLLARRVMNVDKSLIVMTEIPNGAVPTQLLCSTDPQCRAHEELVSFSRVASAPPDHPPLAQGSLLPSPKRLPGQELENKST